MENGSGWEKNDLYNNKETTIFPNIVYLRKKKKNTAWCSCNGGEGGIQKRQGEKKWRR